MGSARTDLILYYAGFGFVLFLIWGVLAHDANRTIIPGWVRTATVVLTVVGLAHPAGMLAAWDLRRQLARNGAEAPPGPTVAGLVPVLVSFAIAAVAVLLLA